MGIAEGCRREVVQFVPSRYHSFPVIHPHASYRSVLECNSITVLELTRLPRHLRCWPVTCGDRCADSCIFWRRPGFFRAGSNGWKLVIESLTAGMGIDV